MRSVAAAPLAAPPLIRTGDAAGVARPSAVTADGAEPIAARVLDAAGSPGAAGAGAPLGEASRAAFEARFGRDLGQVRLHDDRAAHAAAEAIGARAFTLGPHIVFARGEYRPETARGRRLLAHELVHVLQQDRAGDRHDAAPSLLPRRRVPAGVIQRSPVAAIEVIAGLAQTASFASDLHSQSLGGLSYSSSVAHRISDKPQPATRQWNASCLILNAASREYASAAFDVHWEGNDYGEIGSARVRVSLPHTTAFTYSSATVAFEALPNLIKPGGDKRTWQMAWEYEGSFDLGGPGYLMFQGGFAIDAFGNFVPTRHVVVDRSSVPPQPGGFKLAPVLDPALLVVPGVRVERPIPPPPAATP